MSFSKQGTGNGRKADYEVGYGRPPVATRFKPGNNCNPRGRPKQKKTVSQLIDEAMNTKVRITVDGKARIMTKQQVVIHNLVNAAARGDRKAIHTLFSASARYQNSTETIVNPSDLDANDREIIEQFLTGASQNGATLNSSPPDDQPHATEDEASRDTAAPETEGGNEA